MHNREKELKKIEVRERERARENLSRRIGIAIVQQDAIVQQKNKEKRNNKIWAEKLKKTHDKKSIQIKKYRKQKKKTKKEYIFGYLLIISKFEMA